MKLMREKIFYFFFLLVFLTGSVNAITVKTVYRADIRNPEQVFLEGFTAWGTNINYMSHILGLSGSSGQRNSAFIPTSSNHDIADNFARERAVATGSTYYIYNIRATDNFYPALDTVYHIYDTHNVRVSDDVRATVAREQEYTAYSSISSSQIRSVEMLTFTNGQWVTETRENPNYIDDATTHSHDGPYLGSDNSPLNHSARLLVGFSGIGAAFIPSEDQERNHPAIFCLNCLGKTEL